MCSLLDGLDEILDDAFFDELTRLSIEDNDDSPTLNEFLASQKENYNNLINQRHIVNPANEKLDSKP